MQFEIICLQYMDIPLQKQDTQAGDNSIQDALFHYESQFLLTASLPKKQQHYKLSYSKSFTPIITGTILKKTLNTSWTGRYFVLTSTRLIYYSDPAMQVLKGCFVLASLVEYGLKMKAQHPEISLGVRVNNEQQEEKVLIQLRIQDLNVWKEWRNGLKKVIDRLNGLSIQDLLLFPKIKRESILETNFKLSSKTGNFWNSFIISIPQLTKYASHLDIILLRSKNPLFYFHRFFMRSYYDHIALLVQDETEKVFLFEAIQSKGVCISSLQSLLATFRDQYEELGYRKLIVGSKANFHIQKLQEYINSLLGSKYQLSLPKLLLDNETIDPQTQSKSEQTLPYSKQQKTYFCSQLIADLYLKFGILSSGKSNNFWPKDFQQDEIPLSKGFKLSPIFRLQLQQPPQSSQLSQS